MDRGNRARFRTLENPVSNRLSTGQCLGKFDQMLAARMEGDESQYQGAALCGCHVPGFAEFSQRDKAATGNAALSRAFIQAGRTVRKPGRLRAGLRSGGIPGSNR
jgi:hypothetical protein